MASQIVPFQFEGAEEVRVVVKDGEPWFVAVDLCTALGLTSMTKAVGPIPEEEKGVNPIQTLGGTQQVVVLTEAGMWHLVMRSDKPRAPTHQLSRCYAASMSEEGFALVEVLRSTKFPGISLV